MSVHWVNGALTISAAPGGNIVDERGGTWKAEFTCAGCHNPHGTYSDRLLHNNPNGMSHKMPEDGGIKAHNVPVVNYLYGNKYSTGTKYIAVRGTKANHALTGSEYDSIPPNHLVIMIYEKTGYGTTYKKTTNPWLLGVHRTAGTGKHYYTRLFTDSPENIFSPFNSHLYPTDEKIIDDYDNGIDGLQFEYKQGLVHGPATGILKQVNYAEISRAYIVKFDLLQVMEDDGVTPKMYGSVPITTVNQRALFARDLYNNEDYALDKFKSFRIGYSVSGLGVAMSTFCSTCHVDYLAKSGSESGIYTSAYRHTTTTDEFTCVRCHYAHGTDVEIMRDSKNRTVSEIAQLPNMDATKAVDYMLDKNPSSALKRYTNMSICWGCHTYFLAEQLVNNSTYHDDDDPMGPSGKEGKSNWPGVGNIPAHSSNR
jgi:hypothetical protein